MFKFLGVHCSALCCHRGSRSSQSVPPFVNSTNMQHLAPWLHDQHGGMCRMCAIKLGRCQTGQISLALCCQSSTSGELSAVYRQQGPLPPYPSTTSASMYCTAMKVGASRSGVTPGSRGFLRPVRHDVLRPQACGPRRSRIGMLGMQPTSFDAIFGTGLDVSPCTHRQIIDTLQDFEKRRSRYIPVDVFEVSVSRTPVP